MSGAVIPRRSSSVGRRLMVPMPRTILGDNDKDERPFESEFSSLPVAVVCDADDEDRKEDLEAEDAEAETSLEIVVGKLLDSVVRPVAVVVVLDVVLLESALLKLGAVSVVVVVVVKQAVCRGTGATGCCEIVIISSPVPPSIPRRWFDGWRRQNRTGG